MRRALDAATIVAAFALLASFSEVSIQLFRHYILGQITFITPEFAWMAPASYLWHFGKLLFLAILVSVFPWAQLRYVAFLPAAFLATFSLLLLIPGFHRYAVAVLALGIAVELTRRFGVRPGLPQAARRTVAVLGSAALALGIGMTGWSSLRENLAYRRLPSSRAGAPNVIFIILDTVRSISLGLYGYQRPTTPALEQLAKRGVVFERAFAPAPWTLLSHATLFTGRYPHELAVNWTTPLEKDVPTLAETLRVRGYITGGFSSNQRYATREVGLARGFDRFQDIRVSLQQISYSSAIGQFIGHKFRNIATRLYDRRISDAINVELLSWLDARGKGHPFFAFLNYMEAHGPYYVRGAYLKQVGGNPDRPQDRYDAGIARMDHQIGLLLDSLAARGLLDNTIVVVTADHGEQFGEHGLKAHGNSLYDEVLRVPLLLVAPGRAPAGQRVAEVVTLRDVPATIVDLIDGNAPAPSLPGSPLTRFWSDSLTKHGNADSPILAMVHQGIRTLPEEPVTRGDMHSILEWPWQYIRNSDGTEELYDLLQDPHELRNHAADPARRSILDKSRLALARALKNEY